MSIQEREISYIFNSATETGAQKIGTLGNKFVVQLDNPISIPGKSHYATAECVSANIWNVSPNISEEIGNNHFFFNEVDSGGAQDITIPDGSYGIEELEAFLQGEFVNLGAESNAISFSSFNSTQQTVLTFASATTTVDFSQPNTCRDVLGFDSRVVVPTTAGQSIFSDTEARFNRITNYLVKSNLLSGGIPQNTSASGILTSVPITSRVGSQIVFQPVHPVKANADELIGQMKQSIMFTLLDQLERDVSTLGEEWSLTIVIRYYIMETGRNQQSGGTMTSGGDFGLRR